jgi:hypothetical protein
VNGLRNRRRTRDLPPAVLILIVVTALLSAALTCGEIERRTEAVDPMYHEDEIDVMVDWGATLQAQEATAQAAGQPKPPDPAAENEDIPDLSGEDSPADDGQPSGGDDTPDMGQPDEDEEPPITDFAGSWHSDAVCEAADAPYRWEIELRQTGDVVTGTISFHDCPGGGRAEYQVEGTATANNFVELGGILTGKRGDLGNEAPDTLDFTVRPQQPPDPNLAP